MSEKRFWNAAQDGGEALICIDNDIEANDWWGDGYVTARGFRQELGGLRGTLNLLVNSRGGDTFAAADIYCAIREYAAAQKQRVKCYVTGLAASAASVIAMAADEVYISPVGTMMVHDPWTGCWGNATEMRAMADVLDTVRDALCAAYVLHTGKTRDEINQLLAEETWMSAERAVELGFADGIAVYEGGAGSAGAMGTAKTAISSAWNYGVRRSTADVRIAAAIDRQEPLGENALARMRESAEGMKKAILHAASGADPNMAATRLRMQMRLI